MMAGDTVVSVSLVLYYKSWFGDSLNACRMSVYELNDEWLNDRKTADNYRYTDFDITKYYDPNKLLGRKAYSAYDATIPDSVRNATDSYGNPIYYPYVAFRLDKEQYGNRILKLNREYQEGKNDYFKNAENFINNIFKGIYAKSDYGDGTILYIDRVDLQMQFRFHYVDEETGLALKKSLMMKMEKQAKTLYIIVLLPFSLRPKKLFRQTSSPIQTNYRNVCRKQTGHTSNRQPESLLKQFCPMTKFTRNLPTTH